jgi:gamma-glutamyl-gamma-aminobutyrate hydrolase PuuD
VASSGSDARTPARRPRIGMTTYLEDARWGVWERPAALVPQVYLDAVDAAGGIPLLLPPREAGPGAPVELEARDTVEVLDGLLVIGGADVDPAGYGEQPHPTTSSRPRRDAHEVALLRAARRRGLPVLGVCRGAQLMNVMLGGTLQQHLPEQVGHDRHRPGPGEFGACPVRIEPGTRLHDILGAEVKVPCYHHQALGRLADGLRATATADDGTVEAVETAQPEREEWFVGVQWHPEEDPGDLRLFEAHVEAARARIGRPTTVDEEA